MADNKPRTFQNFGDLAKAIKGDIKLLPNTEKGIRPDWRPTAPAFTDRDRINAVKNLLFRRGPAIVHLARETRLALPPRAAITLEQKHGFNIDYQAARVFEEIANYLGFKEEWQERLDNAGNR